MARRSNSSIYDKLLVGAVLMLAAEFLGPVPLIGPIIQIVGMVL